MNHEEVKSWLIVVALVARLIAVALAAIAGALMQEQGVVAVQDVPGLSALSSKLSGEPEASLRRQ